MKKSLLFFSGILLIAAFFQPSCSPIKPIRQNADVLFSKDEISLNKYDVYVHSSKSSIRLGNVLVSGDTLYANGGEISNGQSARQAVTIYTNVPVPSGNNPVKEKIILTKKEISQVIFPNRLKKTNASEKDKDGTGIALGLLILLIILSILLLWLVIYLIVQSSNAAAQSSSNGSGSNSNSGTSSNGGGSSSGCYIATMVYGSYDAPEVMTLRKFRDDKLNHSAAGRAFIRWYYSWSPGFVQKYNHLSWLHKIIRVLLNGLVKLLS
jgi:hypothetical protein